jgi:hypothetical protein
MSQKSAKPKVCKFKGCTKTYEQHSGKRCPSCGESIEHHFDGKSENECWEGLARTAYARQQAGPTRLVFHTEDGDERVKIVGELTDTDREALRRFPNPPMLSSGGY